MAYKTTQEQMKGIQLTTHKLLDIYIALYTEEDALAKLVMIEIERLQKFQRAVWASEIKEAKNE